MRVVLVFLAGMLLGLALVVAALWFNPLDRGAIDVPIDPSERSLVLAYDSPISGSLYYANSGVEGVPGNPAIVDPLDYPAQRGAHVAVQPFMNQRGDVVGIGIKHFALAESSQLAPPRVTIASAWQVLIPGAGSFFVAQEENYWPFLQEVLIPAALGDGSWRGRYAGDTTIGPKGTLEGLMFGASGLFQGRTGVAKETLQLDRFSLLASGGPATAYATMLVVPDAVEVAPADDPLNPPSE